MNTKLTKEEIINLLHMIEEIQQSLLYVAMVHPVGKMLGVDKEQIQHLSELKFYMYIAWELYHYGDVNSIISEKDKKLFAMFKAKAYDNNGNRIPENDIWVAKIPETIEYVKTDNVLIDCYGSIQEQLLSFMLTIQELSHNQNREKTLNECTESEKFIIDALQQLTKGNDGDATYHLLYKAWRSFQKKPEQLKFIQNYGNFGIGLMFFLSYGTVSDIDDRQQLASISYLFLSKALKKDPSNVNLLKNRLILMISNKEAFGYTVSSVINKDSNFDDFLFINLTSPLKKQDAMYKMEYADLSRDKRLLSIDMLSNTYETINSYLINGGFGKNETKDSIIKTGNRYHNEVIESLEKKVICEGDIDF